MSRSTPSLRLILEHESSSPIPDTDSDSHLSGRLLVSRSLGLFPLHHPLRSLCVRAIKNKWSFRFIVCVVALNSAILAVYDPVADVYNQFSIRNRIVLDSQVFFQVVYTVEMLIKMVALGVAWEATEGGEKIGGIGKDENVKGKEGERGKAKEGGIGKDEDVNGKIKEGEQEMAKEGGIGKDGDVNGKVKEGERGKAKDGKVVDGELGRDEDMNGKAKYREEGEARGGEAEDVHGRAKEREEGNAIIDAKAMVGKGGIINGGEAKNGKAEDGRTNSGNSKDDNAKRDNGRVDDETHDRRNRCCPRWNRGIAEDRITTDEETYESYKGRRCCPTSARKRNNDATGRKRGCCPPRNKTTYFSSFWNWIDFIVVMLGWVAFVWDLLTNGQANSFLRVVRILRALRGIQFVPGLAQLHNTVARSIEQLFDVFALLLIVYYVLALVGMTVFMGKLHQRCGYLPVNSTEWMLWPGSVNGGNWNDGYYCSNSTFGGLHCPVGTMFLDPSSNISYPVSCASEFPAPNAGLTGFDNIFQASLTVFVVVTVEGFADIMMKCSQVTSDWAQIYFIVVVLFGSLILLSLITAVLTVNYKAEREKFEKEKLKRIKHKKMESLSKIVQHRESTAGKKIPTTDLLVDLELRLIYSYEQYSNDEGYHTVSQTEYDTYVKKHTRKEIDQFYTRVAVAKKKRREFLEPEGHAYLFSKGEDTQQQGENGAHADSKGENDLYVAGKSNKIQPADDDEENCVPLFNAKKLYAQKSNNDIDIESPSSPSHSAAPSTANMTLPSLVASPSSRLAPRFSFAMLNRNNSVGGVILSFAPPPGGHSSSSLPTTSEDATPMGNINDPRKFKLLSHTSMLKSQKWLNYDPEFGVPLGETSPSYIVQGCYVLAMNAQFKIFIWAMIVLNTIILAYGHFLQPVASIYPLNIVNYALTGVYTFEMIVKIWGFGRLCYAKDTFSVFDFVVVWTSWVGLIIELSLPGSPSSMISALRTLRMLRLFRLAENWPSLKLLLRTIIRTILGIYPFSVLLFAFLFVFVVSGLTLFGGQVSLQPFVYDPITRTTSANPEWDCTRAFGSFYTANYVHCPPRVNYDDFLWSLVTSFQILTRENWDALMYTTCDGMDSWVPALYFVLVMCVGSIIVLSLFLGILIDAFLTVQEEIENEKALESSNSLMKSESNDDDNLEKWVTSEFLTVDVGQEHGRLTDNPAFKCTALIGLAPTNRVRVAAAVFLQTSVFKSFVIFVILFSCALLIAANPYWAPPPLPPPQPDEEKDFVLNCLNVFVISVFFLEAVLKIIAFGFVFNRGSYLRSGWNILDFVVVVTSLLALVIADNPGLNAFKAMRALRALKLIQHIKEMRVIVNALGASIFPVIRVATVASLFYLIFAVIATTLFGGKTYTCMNCSGPNCSPPPVNISLGMIETNRTCYPYRGYGVVGCSPLQQCVGAFDTASSSLQNPEFSLWQNMRYEGSGVGISFDNVGSSLLLLMEISTSSLFLEPLHVTTDIIDVGHSPIRGASDSYSLFFVVFIAFANFFLLNLFVAAVVESFAAAGARVTGQAFMTDDQYQWIQLHRRATLVRFQRRLLPPTSRFDYFKLRTFCFWLANNKMFNDCILGAIIVNTIVLSFPHYQMVPAFSFFLDIFNYIFAIIYIFEMTIKIIGLGFMPYVRRFALDFFIVLTIIAAFIVSTVPDASDLLSVFEIFRVLRVFRLMTKHNGMNNLLTTLRHSIPAVMNMFLLLVLVFFVYAIVGMQFFGLIPTTEEYASQMSCIGLQLNFHSFGASFVTLFTIAAGENWQACMRDLALENGFAWAFGFTFQILIQFALLNVLVAIVLSNFDNVLGQKKEDHISDRVIQHYADLWSTGAHHFYENVCYTFKYDLESWYDEDANANETDKNRFQKVTHRGPRSFRIQKHDSTIANGVDTRIYKLVKRVYNVSYMPPTFFSEVFRKLPPPLGLTKSNHLTATDVLRFIRLVNIPLTTTNMVNDRAALASLIDHSLGTTYLQDKSKEILNSAFRTAIRKNKRALQTHAKRSRETTTTHTLAEELASRRVQISARYLLGKKRILESVEKGELDEHEASRLMSLLVMERLREVAMQDAAW